MDDVLGEPFLVDSNADGVGDRVRPGTTVKLKCRASFSRLEEQRHDAVGNAPTSLVSITLYSDDLVERGVLATSGATAGVPKLRTNDRLLRLESPDGAIRADFSWGGRQGLFCVEVRPGDTGTGTFVAVFEGRRAVAR